MKKFILMAVPIVMASLLVSGCSVKKEDVGLVGGAVAGGLIGSAVSGNSTAGTIIGAAGGAYAGKEIAKRMD